MRERIRPLLPGADESVREWARRFLPVVAAVLAALVVLAAVGAWVYFDALAHGPTAAPAAAGDRYAVAVERGYDGYVLRPADGEATTGLVFYPGGRVEPGAYVHSLAAVAEAGVVVVIPGMPLNLAVLDSDAAGAVTAGEPGIDRWYVGGHSLGGAMACRYAARDASDVDGLVLAASYCDVDVADANRSVLAVLGTRDGVMDAEQFQRSRSNLPAGATVRRIEGMNHTQFGSYRGQRGDRPATIPTRRAHALFVEAVVGWLCDRGAPIECGAASARGDDPAAVRDGNAVGTVERGRSPPRRLLREPVAPRPAVPRTTVSPGALHARLRSGSTDVARHLSSEPSPFSRPSCGRSRGETGRQ